MALRGAAVNLAAAATIALAAAPASASPVLLMHRDGTVGRHDDRFLPPRAGEELAGGRARAASAPRPATKATRAALARLLREGAIDQPTYDRAIGDVDRAADLV